MDITFITGNQKKADYLARHLGLEVKHKKIDLDEIQSLDLKEIVRHKVMQAYEHINAPVLVEDVSLEFLAWGRLPGTYIKWFLEEMDYKQICALLDGKDRSARARCVFGYYDGSTLKMFEGLMNGRIAEEPASGESFGWDNIFIPEGYNITRAELGEEDDRKTYLKIKPLEKVREFLLSLNN